MIFISYSSEDEESAICLYDALRNAGYTCQDIFLDRDHRSGIELGADWEKVLRENASQCRALLTLVSPGWLESRWCFAELAVAKTLGSGTHILPVVLQDLNDSGWRRSGLDGLQQFHLDIDAVQDAGMAIPETLCERLKRLGLGPTDHLRPAIDRHPNRVQFRFETWDQWSAKTDMNSPLQLGTEQLAFIETLLSKLTDHGNEVRISGDPGSGKTRLVLEAIRRTPNLRRQTLYYDDPSGVLDEPYINELLVQGSKSTHLIVVDDCNLREYRQIQDRLASIRDRMILVTITHDPTVDAITVPPLSDEQITAILASYRSDLRHLLPAYVKCCEKSPRFAHLVGESLKADAGSIVAHPDADRIVERIICGKVSIGSVESQVRMTVARFASLFDRFGVEQPYAKELATLVDWIAEYHPSIGFGDVLSVVRALRQIRVLQGKRTVYFVPKALQRHLWRQWWQIYGSGFRMEQIELLDLQLRAWFVSSLEQYCETSPIEEIADRLLRFDDWFYQINNLNNRWGAHLFRILGEHSPELALTCIGRMQIREFDDIGRTFSSWIKSKSAAFYAIVDVIEYASLWKRTAFRAMRMLRDFALAEDDENGHATKAFCSFFTLGTGYSAATELEPKERVVLLDELLDSPDEQHSRLGLLSLAAALDRQSHFRSRNWYRFGRQHPPSFWLPPNRDAYFAEHISIWNRLTGFVQQTTNQEQLTKAWDVIGRAFHSFVQSAPLADHCLESLGSLAIRCEVSLTKSLISSIIHLWRVATTLPDGTRNKMKALYFDIINRSFETRLKRYVGMGFFEDGAELSFDFAPLDDIDEGIQRLADQCFGDRNTLVPHVPWLLTSADRAWHFGLAIGTRDVDTKWSSDVIDWQRQHSPGGNTAFIGGYLEAVRRQSMTEFGKLVQTIADDSILQGLLTAIVARTGGVADSVDHITQLLEKNEIPVESLTSLRYMHNVTAIAEHVFIRWIELLRQAGGNEHLGLALNFLFGRFKEESSRPIPAQLIANFLADSTMIKMVRDSRTGQENYEYNWGKLLELLTEDHQTLAVSVARAFFESFLQEPETFNTRPGAAIDESVWRVLELQPQAAWSAFFDVLRFAEGKQTYEMFHWLGAKSYYSDGTNLGLWPTVPEPMLWQWIDEELPERAELVANQLPPLVTEYGLTTITCHFLRRYTRFTEACDCLVGTRVPGVVEGSYEEYNKKRLQRAIEVRGDCSDPIILIWLNKHIAELTADLERRPKIDDEDERR